MLSATLGILLPSKRKKTIIGVAPRKPVTSLEARKIWLGTGLAAISIVMLVAHIFSVNYSVGIGYEVSAAQKKVSSLREDNKRLMLKVSETGSIARLQENFSAENYVPVTSIDYVNAKNQTAVSMNK